MASRTLVIAGATATGKTAVSIEVARRLDGEVISMDSRQVYRGMDIGTAKPPADQRCGVPHHGFDVVDPDERFNAGRFADLAHACLAAIRAHGRVPILAGGTGFYLRALTHPMFAEPALSATHKERWKLYLRALDTEELARWAAALDPAASMQVQDRQRLARIIEIAVLTGQPLSWWQRSAPPHEPPIDPVIFVLDLPRDVLYRRIEARVDTMVEAGLTAEVERLIAAGYNERDPGMNATGYIELMPYVRGERPLSESIDLVKAATRRYARRQHTWLRHQLPAGAVHIAATASVAQMADAIATEWNEAIR